MRQQGQDFETCDLLTMDKLTKVDRTSGRFLHDTIGMGKNVLHVLVIFSVCKCYSHFSVNE